MQTASVSELKSKLSGYLKQVKAGEEVIVFERGRAIARVVPYTEVGPTPSRIREMIRAGKLIPASRPTPPDFWERPLVKDPDGFALQALLQEREEGR